jgi:hypothetical protein
MGYAGTAGMTLLHRRREGFNINYTILIAAQFLINHHITFSVV